MPQFAVISSTIALALMALILVLCRFELRGQHSWTGAALRRLQGVDPVISFCFNEHISFSTWEPDAAGTWRHSQVLARPGWQKTTRCTGNSSMSCEECAGDRNCWSSGDGSREVKLEAGSSHYRRFLNTIQVRCSSPTLNVKYEVQDLHAGELRILWDGEDVSQQWSILTSGLATPLVDQSGTYQEVNSVESRSGSLSIATEHPGGHTLQIEFIPFTNSSSVKLTKLEVSMPKTFADCEDYKACLDPISNNHELRNSNSLQLKCLQDAVPFSEDCARWRGCLTEERQDQLRILLLAAGVGGYKANASTSGHASAANSSTASINQEDGGQCLNPLVQDAQSWACDCFDEMQSACAVLASGTTNVTLFTDELCMRAKFCEHPRICATWKEQACDDDEIKQMQTLLAGVEAGPGRLLASRRERARDGASESGRNSDDDKALDRALMSKSCE